MVYDRSLRSLKLQYEFKSSCWYNDILDREFCTGQNLFKWEEKKETTRYFNRESNRKKNNFLRHKGQNWFNWILLTHFCTFYSGVWSKYKQHTKETDSNTWKEDLNNEKEICAIVWEKKKERICKKYKIQWKNFRVGKRLKSESAKW